jgi:hypothetical protein
MHQARLAQQFRRRKRVNRGALGNVADWNELVRSMGDGQQSRSIGERGNAVSRVESRFEQSWAHLERGFFTGQARYVTRQNHAELPKRLDFETFQGVSGPCIVRGSRGGNSGARSASPGSDAFAIAMLEHRSSKKKKIVYRGALSLRVGLPADDLYYL